MQRAATPCSTARPLGCLTSPGRFFGVGLGPGDPDLLTVKARRLIRKCPVLCVPKGSEKTEGPAMALLRKLRAGRDQEIIVLPFPMTLDPEKLAAAWYRAAAIIAAKLSQGKDVAFLTEGDPMLYSTFIYVFQALKSVLPGLAAEVVPGITSVTAAAARVQMPLATGNETLAIVPATGDRDYLAGVLVNSDNIVFLKINRSFDTLLGLLEEKGLIDKAVLVTRCSMPGEEIMRDIRAGRGRKLDYFSLLLVKKK